jgi:hypothetical protein
MTEHENHDAALRALLRANAPEPPVDDVDWHTLHARIAQRAQPLLQRGNVPVSSWHMLARWSHIGVPLTAAAAAIAVLFVASDTFAPRTMTPAELPVATASQSFVTVEEALTYTITDEERSVLIAGADEAEMLDAVLFFEEEL